MDARLIITLALATACTAAEGEGSPPAADEEVFTANETPACGQMEPRNDSEVLICNDLGEGIIANVAMPSGARPPKGWPGVIVLHGSGGLHESGPDDEDPCSEALELRFSNWAEILNERGYAVIMPSSFYSRGFCEWNDSTRPDDLDDHERLVFRTFDAVAAARWMCNDPRVDCSRLAMLGFSNGGSVALMLMHEELGDAADPRLRAIEHVPSFVGAVAYYPGCGLEDELFNDLDVSQLDRYYYPSGPIWVAHAEKDKLLDDCLEIRDPQVDIVSLHRGVQADMFEMVVYDNAKHAFDGSTSDDRKADWEASVAAQAITLEKLEQWFY